MTEVFACPECGLELTVAGVSPGLEVQCESCSTWVEVPYLPRTISPRRGHQSARRSPWASKALGGAIVFAFLALVGLIAMRMIGGRVRSDRERVLAELVASADRAERGRQPDQALREIEGALAHARTFEREGSTRLDELTDRRDRIALLEARSRLAGVEALDPEAAVGESLILADRARRDPALAPVADEVEAALASSRSRRAESDLNLARQALESGNDSDAATLAIRLHDHARDLQDTDSRRYRDAAEVVIETAVSRSGVTLPAVEGRFSVGSPEGYASRLDRIRDEALKAKGYLPQPHGKSPWAKVWDEKAPFVQSIQLTESQDGLYLQSKNRTTSIDGTLELFQGDQLAWKARVIGRTRSPLLGLPAYLAGHLATAGRRDPDVEKRLHADAFDQFVEQAARNLRGLPAMKTPGKD